MATPQEYVQSILTGLALVQAAGEETMNTPGVVDILAEMDSLTSELVEVLG